MKRIRADVKRFVPAFVAGCVLVCAADLGGSWAAAGGAPVSPGKRYEFKQGRVLTTQGPVHGQEPPPRKSERERESRRKRKDREALDIFFATVAEGSVMRVQQTRTYVKGYEVRDGIVLPVTGTLTNKIEIRTTTPRLIRSSKPSDQKTLRKFFGEESGSAPVKPQEPVPSARTEIRPQAAGPRTTTVVGMLRRGGDGTLTLAVAYAGKEVVYALAGAGPARALLEEEASDALRVILVGSVNEKSEPGVLRVQSVWCAVANETAPDKVTQPQKSSTETQGAE